VGAEGEFFTEIQDSETERVTAEIAVQNYFFHMVHINFIHLGNPAELLSKFSHVLSFLFFTNVPVLSICYIQSNLTH